MLWFACTYMYIYTCVCVCTSLDTVIDVGDGSSGADASVAFTMFLYSGWESSCLHNRHLTISRIHE